MLKAPVEFNEYLLMIVDIFNNKVTAKLKEKHPDKMANLD